jgi:hypothetical protein
MILPLPTGCILILAHPIFDLFNMIRDHGKSNGPVGDDTVAFDETPARTFSEYIQKNLRRHMDNARLSSRLLPSLAAMRCRTVCFCLIYGGLSVMTGTAEAVSDVIIFLATIEQVMVMILFMVKNIPTRESKAWYLAIALLLSMLLGLYCDYSVIFVSAVLIGSSSSRISAALRMGSRGGNLQLVTSRLPQLFDEWFSDWIESQPMWVSIPMNIGIIGLLPLLGWFVYTFMYEELGLELLRCVAKFRAAYP